MTWDHGRRFSARKGLIHKKIQKDSIDVDTTNLLWNECGEYFNFLHMYLSKINAIDDFLRHFWVEFFCKSYDSLDGQVRKQHMAQYGSRLLDGNRFAFIYHFCATHFASINTPYNERLDLIQHILDFAPSNQTLENSVTPMMLHNRRSQFIEDINNRFEQCLTTFRIIGYFVVEIINDIEISSIQSAIASVGKLENVGIHTSNALRLYAQRPTPDYVNSIKESISSVECVCKIIADLPNATLGQALQETVKRLDINTDLKESIYNLYKYTCNAEGIRHALKSSDKGSISAEDALHMLVTCSSTVNFLTEKARKNGII